MSSRPKIEHALKDFEFARSLVVSEKTECDSCSDAYVKLYDEVFI